MKFLLKGPLVLLPIKARGFFLLGYLIALGSFPNALARENKFRTTAYVGLTLVYSTFGGDLNVSSTYRFPDETILVPKIRSDLGYRLFLGIRGELSKKQSLSAELGYCQSTHDKDAPSGPPGASVFFNQITLNLRNSFFTDRATQPFLTAEVSRVWLNVRAGSLFGPNEVAMWGDSGYRGYGFGVGGGLSHNFRPSFSVHLGVLLRWVMIDTVRGHLGEIRDVGGLNSISPNIALSVAYDFLEKRQ